MSRIINPQKYGCAPGKEPEFVEYYNEVQDEVKLTIQGKFPHYTVFVKEEV